jgi:serine/threonine protein kinase
VSGSNVDDRAKTHQTPMAADLAHRSYTSSRLLDTFLEGTPEVTQKHAEDLREKYEWNDFIASCTDGKKGNPSTHKSSGSNEKEFKALVQCIASLGGLRKYFEKPRENTQNEPEINNPRRGCIRISHQRDSLMATWNTKARWICGNCDSTKRQMELKPDLMTVVVEDAKPKFVRLAIPQTILPPPDDWQPAMMDDTSFPMVECKEPVWECLDLFWECQRNSQQLKNAEMYINCALKAAEALRYQWSRRYVYCFLQCGSMMRLLHFDRSGLVASEHLDIEIETDKFIKCLLGVFCHEPSRLGYPAGKEVPFHKRGPDNKLLQVVTVGGRQLYLYDQEAGPLRGHLVGRATVAFRAKLVNPEGEKETGRDWCYKSSWPQKLRKHEGDYLKSLQGLSNVVDLLVYGVVKIKNENDTTVVGRKQCSSGQPMTILETFHKATDFTRHAGTATSSRRDLEAMPQDLRQPGSGSQQVCDEKEHRDIVTAWVSSSFDEAISSLDSLSTIFSIWEQAFSAIKAITERGIVHRDISFRNIRIDDQHKLKVCDFDMAMSLDGQSTGAQDRTGTIAFMATSILGPQPYTHRPIHDCESIFWLCALELLDRVSKGEIRRRLENIWNARKDIDSVMDAKVSVVMTLYCFESKGGRLERHVDLEKPKNSSLFFRLTALMREFVNNNFVNDYYTMEEGTDGVCFDRCIKIIQQALDADDQQVTGGIAEMSLSPSAPR